MIVTKANVSKDSTSCNFCSRGELNRLQYNLIFPYETVYEVTKGHGIKVAICDQCIDELSEKVQKIRNDD